MKVLWPNGSSVRPNVSSPFGPRSAPVAGASRVHRGTDFTGFSYVRAIAAGRVVAVGAPGGWAGGGTQVWVQHDGFFTRSMHMRAGSTQVYVGQQIDVGQILGVMGMTGTASGVHLHLEITYGRVHYSNTGQVDPVAFINDRLSSFAGGDTAPTPAPVPEEDDDMPKLIRWNELHVFSLDRESVYYVDTTAEQGTLEALHGRPAQDVDNVGITAAVNERGIHWDAVDAVLRKAGPGGGGRYWSRLMAEGIAIRGEQAEQSKTLDDVLATAKALEPKS